MPTMPMEPVNIYVALCGSGVHKQSRICVCSQGRPNPLQSLGLRGLPTGAHYTGLSCGPVQMGCCNTFQWNHLRNPDSSGSQVLGLTSVLDLITSEAIQWTSF